MRSVTRTKFFYLLLCISLTASLYGSIATVTRVYAASLVVNTTADDTTAGNGNCTLREAINNANSNSDTTGGDCAAGSGTDTITFNSLLSGNTISLTSDLPALSDNVIIDGSALASKITINGMISYLPFIINSGKTVTLDSLIITNHHSASGDGGGIHNSGTLTVQNSTLSNNSAGPTGNSGGGIYNNSGATLTVKNSTFTNNNAVNGYGGGIYNYGGTLTVTDSTFSTNGANTGGGIYNTGTLTVANSTFNGNNGPTAGGGIFNNFTATLTNSTFSSNNAGNGGGVYSSGTLILTNSTFSGNSGSTSGGGLNDGGNLSLVNTIIANSTSGGDCVKSGGSIVTEKNNMIEDFAHACGLTLGMNGDIINTDPNLGSLASNGGSTQTMALLPGSQAIDTGDDTTCNNAPVSGKDQRGVTRPQGTHCDIGAFETTAQLGPAFFVNSTSDTSDGSCDSPVSGGSFNCTLREAINVANTHSGADTITFASGLSGLTITLTSNLPALSDDVTIDGSALALKITIDGNNHQYRPFYINSGKTVTLKSLVIANGHDSSSGGGVYNYGTLTLTDSTLSGNTADQYGGGVYNLFQLTITNSIITGNNSSQYGGGVFNNGNMTVTKSTFSGNTSTLNGGGISDYNVLSVTNSTFSGNSTSGSGGGIYIYPSSTLTLTNDTLSGNSAGSGGGIFNSGGTLNIANTIIANSPSGGDCLNSGGIINSEKNNLIESSSYACSLTNGTNGDIIGSDPNLDVLSDNGGPAQTMALLAGSLGIDAGDDATCAGASVNGLDQRGVTRPKSAHCDIGAFEYTAQIGPTFIVSLTADSDDGSCDLLGQGFGNFGCTLREAINAANSHGGADTITFDSSLSGGIITLNSGLPLLNDNVTIDGSALASKITIDGVTHYEPFAINSGKTVIIDSLIIANGYASSGGGILIFSGGNLTVKHSIISGNSADNGGGGIYNGSSGTLTVTDTTLSGNNGTYGGGIANYGSTLTVTKSTFSGNSGEAIVNGGTSSATLVNSTFSGNSSGSTSTHGGGVFNFGTLSVINSTFSGNGASASGGGIYNSGGTLNLTNTIIANSTSGGDCVNAFGGTIGSEKNNLIEDSSNACGLTNGVNGDIIGSDPMLGVLASNGGPTQTMALSFGGPAVDDGDDTICAAAPVNNESQNGATRPQDGNGDSSAVCDIGAYELDPPPTVASVVRASSNPTSAATVDFTVTFSESVTGVDAGDMGLTTSGTVSGASISNMTGSGATRTVTVNTGSGNGTIRLDIYNNLSIVDSIGNSLSGGDFTSGEIYLKVTTSTFTSIGMNDGWVLESTETSNKGGSFDVNSTSLFVGDDAFNRQYRAILHFNTASLPDTAVITSITLKIKKQGLVGTNPFSTHGALLVDIRKPSFGTTATLAIGDFQAGASQSAATSFGSSAVSNWFSAIFNKTSFPYINLTGTTQFRLRFTKDDNDDKGADYMKFFSGNYATASSRPQLIIQYYVP